MSNSKRQILYLGTFMICCAYSLFATAQHERFQLKVGDKVPDIEFSEVLNYQSSTAKLSDFKGQLIILDFWATWCGSCINMFPKTDSLQQQFKGKLTFILVNSIRTTKDSAKTIHEFLQSWQMLKRKAFSLIIAINDIWSIKFFPHIFLPHYVWIGADRTVLAITGSDAITEENIRTALKGHRLNEPVKGDRYNIDY